MVYGQCLTTTVTSSRRSSVQDMALGGLGMANSKLSDYDFFSSGGGISSVAPVLVSWDIGLCHVQLYPTFFEPTAESRSWLVASNL